jgi:hypothetical protein
MTAPHQVREIDPSKTMPPETGPPSGNGQANYAGVALEGVRQLGGAVERHQEHATTRPARPRASVLAIVLAAALVLQTTLISIVGAIAYLGHQSGTGDYERRQQERHAAVMESHRLVMAELRAQREALYQLIDTVAEHHPEAAKVARELERGRARP